MNMQLKALVISTLSLLLFAGCGEKGSDSDSMDSTSASADDGSHVVVYEEEIYKNWPYQ